jgi:hypothetical protein
MYIILQFFGMVLPMQLNGAMNPTTSFYIFGHYQPARCFPYGGDSSNVSGNQEIITADGPTMEMHSNILSLPWLF